MSEGIQSKIDRLLTKTGALYKKIEIDPAYADTAQFCEKYGYPLENSGNTIVVASKRGEKKFAACLVRASDRLDVNKRVRGLMGVSRLSFASAEDTRELTGMEIGGVTPFALPDHIPIYVDAKVMELDYVILGSGSRSSKLEISPSVLHQLPNVEIVEGLSIGEG